MSAQGPPPAWEVRRRGGGDVLGLAALAAAAAYPREHASLADAGHWVASARPAASWVAIANHDVIGYVACRGYDGDLSIPDWEAAAPAGRTLVVISRLHVDPRHRCQGVAGGLLTAALNWVDGQSATAVLASIFRDHGQAARSG